MTLNYQASDPIILGSGELYIFTGYTGTTPTDTDLINIGAIESGATITIKTNKMEIKSGNRGLVKTVTVDKEIKFATGIMTWIMENISKYLIGSTFSKDETTGEEKMIINKNDESPVVYLRFIHKKPGGGTLTVNLYKAIFNGDLLFEFDEKKPTTINYEFVGLADDDLNYVEFIETFPEA